ncbi:MAG TPA: Ig-like domain-containing protein, partial [Anaerolinea sp.]|nr:Ig-like domain-containing protein [Anaerolinea sp.]
MYKNQAPTKGQSWLLKVGSATLMIALLISSLGFTFSNVSASTPPSSPANSSLPKFLAADSVIGDDTTADFTPGDLNSCSYVSETANGELILEPTAGAEFGGTTLPAGWVDAPWTAYQPGGSSTVSGGQLSVDESLFATTGYYTPGHVLDFVATFQQDVNQHAGLIVDLDSNPNYAIFSMGNPAGSTIKARTMVEGTLTETDTLITTGSPHHFRIEWTDTQVIYYIDNMVSPVATHSAPFVAELRPGFSDLTPGDPVDHTKKLVVDWARMSPYTTPCTFTSRVLDAGAAANWKMLSWTADLPSGTSLAFSYQFGNTASPDSTWSSFIGVPTSGTAPTGRASYPRYRVVLSTSNPAVTPEVQKVQFTYNTDADTSAPAILSRSPASGATGVSRNTDITVTFSELLNAATVNGTSVFLREFGTSVDVPASVSLSAGNLITLNPTATLKQGAVYTVTIKASVADLGNTLLGTAAVWNFTTTSSAIDTTTVDFQGGTGCYVADTSGGEVILTPTVGAEFSGSALTAGWTSADWGAGSSTLVANGIVSIDKARVFYSAGSFAPNHSLEFSATFTASQFQHIGWSAVDNFFGAWAFFSTKDTTTTLYARTSDGTETPIAGDYVGSPHHYRIDWTADTVTFYVDGTQVAQHTVALTDNMFPIASDDTVDGIGILLDWMRVSPYAS